MAEVRTADRGDIRDANLVAVLKTLQRLGLATRAGIARETGLSRPTVSAVINTLIEAELAHVSGTGPASGGRRGEFITINAGARLVLAVDLSSEKPRQAAIDLWGGILPGSSRPVPARAMANPRSLIQWVTRIAAGRPEFIGTALAVPGVTNPVSGVVEWAPSLAWRDVPLRDEIARKFDGLVAVDNDLNLASLGEYACGPRALGDMVMLSFRQGLGAGIILNGRLYRGAHYAAGEVGYLRVPQGARGDRDFGELESALAEQFATSQPQRHGQILELLTLACLAITAVIDVATIVLGEELTTSGDDVPGEIERRLQELMPHAPSVIASSLGEDATLRGAGVAVHQLLEVEPRRLLA